MTVTIENVLRHTFQANVRHQGSFQLEKAEVEEPVHGICEGWHLDDLHSDDLHE